MNILGLLKDNIFGIFIGSFCSLIHGATNPVIGYALAKSVNTMSNNDRNVINKKGRFWGLMLLVLTFVQGISFFLK